MSSFNVFTRSSARTARGRRAFQREDRAIQGVIYLTTYNAILARRNIDAENRLAGARADQYVADHPELPMNPPSAPAGGPPSAPAAASLLADAPAVILHSIASSLRAPAAWGDRRRIVSGRIQLSRQAPGAPLREPAPPRTPPSPIRRGPLFPPAAQRSLGRLFADIDINPPSSPQYEPVSPREDPPTPSYCDPSYSPTSPASRVESPRQAPPANPVQDYLPVPDYLQELRELTVARSTHRRRLLEAHRRRLLRSLSPRGAISTSRTALHTFRSTSQLKAPRRIP